MDLPADLVALGFKLIERNGRYLLISERYGVTSGVTFEEGIRRAREIKRFIEYLDRKQGK